MRKSMLKNNRGQALIISYFLITFFLILALPLMQKVISEGIALNRQQLEKETFYLAEGGIEDATSQFINSVANFQTLPTVTRYPTAGSITTSYASGAQVISVINQAEAGQRNVTDPDGTVVAVKTFVVTSTCQHPLNNSISATINQLIVLRLIYTFQHCVFYADDLEMLPGVNMTLLGRVHSNKDIYLHSYSGTTLTVDSDYLHSASSIFNKSKDGRSFTGTVRIQKAGTSSFADMNGLDSSSANWLTESQDRWKGTAKTSVHGVTKMATPVVGSIQPGGYYATNANVKIENGVITKNGVALVEGVNIPVGTIITDTDFYNNREEKYVRMTNIDLKKLAGYAAGDAEGSPSFQNNLPPNGLVYATRTDAASSESPGIRLLNGSKIYRAGGITLVSNDPVYIQGDYNTSSKQPSSVICDSVNLLSKDWNDANSTGGLNGRIAGTSTVNSSFIAGVDDTTSGHYNGGLENYPRLHENWSSKTLTIRGSFVELWKTQVAQGAWEQPGGTQYRAPTRNWSYDTDLNVNNMPPFTPWAVEAQKGAWWKI